MVAAQIAPPVGKSKGGQGGPIRSSASAGADRSSVIATRHRRRHDRAQINLANSIQASSLIGMGTGLLHLALAHTAHCTRLGSSSSAHCTHRGGRVHQIGAVRDRTRRYEAAVGRSSASRTPVWCLRLLDAPVLSARAPYPPRSRQKRFLSAAGASTIELQMTCRH